MHRNQQIHGLMTTFREGGTSRRSFIQKAAALGLGAPLAAAIAGPAGIRPVAVGEGEGRDTPAILPQP